MGDGIVAELEARFASDFEARNKEFEATVGSMEKAVEEKGTKAKGTEPSTAADNEAQVAADEKAQPAAEEEEQPSADEKDKEETAKAKPFGAPAKAEKAKKQSKTKKELNTLKESEMEAQAKLKQEEAEAKRSMMEKSIADQLATFAAPSFLPTTAIDAPSDEVTITGTGTVDVPHAHAPPFHDAAGRRRRTDWKIVA